MSDNFFHKNPSTYDGTLIESNHELRILVRELLTIINRNGIDLDDDHETQKLLIKIEI